MVDNKTESLPMWVHELHATLTPEARQLLAEIVHWNFARSSFSGNDNLTLYLEYHAIIFSCVIERPLLSSTLVAYFHVDSDAVRRIIREALREWLSHSHGLQVSFPQIRGLLMEISRFCGFSSGLKESLWA